MMVWASSAGHSPRRFHRPAPARRGRNHNINIWSKSPEHKDCVGGGEALLGWAVRLVPVTDPLVLDFQASVNKAFLNFPALWKVSGHVASTFCSRSLEA